MDQRHGRKALRSQRRGAASQEATARRQRRKQVRKGRNCHGKRGATRKTSDRQTYSFSFPPRKVGTQCCRTGLLTYDVKSETRSLRPAPSHPGCPRTVTHCGPRPSLTVAGQWRICTAFPRIRQRVELCEHGPSFDPSRDREEADPSAAKSSGKNGNNGARWMEISRGCSPAFPSKPHQAGGSWQVS